MQFAAALAAGNRALVDGAAGEQLVSTLPAALKPYASVKMSADTPFDAVLFEGDSDELLSLVKEVAKRAGPIASVQGVAARALESGEEDHALERLLTERSVSVNTAAAAGNANLMMIGQVNSAGHRILEGGNSSAPGKVTTDSHTYPSFSRNCRNPGC